MSDKKDTVSEKKLINDFNAMNAKISSWGASGKTHAPFIGLLEDTVKAMTQFIDIHVDNLLKTNKPMLEELFKEAEKTDPQKAKKIRELIDGLK